MTHLLALAVGPVQEFIAAARRTRDLWFGSFLLSEVSKAAAHAVADAGGQLIFPAPQTAADLDPGSELNVANVILAELPAGTDAKSVAASARTAARECWKGFAAQARHEAGPAIRAEVWDEQVGDVIEFAAAWCRFTADTYRADRARVMRLLAGRKNCRDFHPAAERPGLPKSSLDGLRDTVLSDTDRKNWPKKLRLRTGEQLDVVGLTKRLAERLKGDKQLYPSVSRVAADPWLRGRADRLGPVIAECKRLGSDVVRRLNIAPEDGHPHYADFPFEGTAVFASRYHELEEEAGLDREALRPLAAAVARVGGEPNPYLAVLVADGDRMGATIADLLSPDEHRRFSARLAAFAGQARAVVHEHRGVLVYAGGDDVFAFLPVDLCLKCARALHDRFGTLMSDFVTELNATRPNKLEANMTLSVGVAIGHFLENLEDLRRYGQDAEKDAKRPDADGTKDALAVHLHKRGGSAIKVRAKWTTDPDAHIAGYAQLFLDRALPGRFPYDLRRMADVYRHWPGAGAAIRGDVLRLIAAKVGTPAALGRVAAALHDRVADVESLLAFAAELLVARQVAGAMRQARGTGTGGAP